jgi:uncharacterized protein YbjT (DUF2867 family)
LKITSLAALLQVHFNLYFETKRQIRPLNRRSSVALSSQPAILVTGATGNVGRKVVSQLLELGMQVRALSRNAETANLPSGTEIVEGDLSAPGALESALTNIEKVFLLCRGYSVAGVPALVQTMTRSVREIVFLSSSAVQDELPVQSNPIARIHHEVERAIRRTKVRWTFLRPGAFAANALTWWAPQLRKGEILRWPYAKAAWAPIHERDIAAVAVRALIESGHDGKTYFLTGGQVLTQEEQLRAIGEASGRTFKFEELSADDARKGMSATMPPFVVDRLLDMWARMVDSPGAISNVVEEITGNPATTFRQWALEHSLEFQPMQEWSER